MPMFPADLVFDVHVVGYLDAVLFVANLSSEERLFFRALVKIALFRQEISSDTYSEISDSVLAFHPGAHSSSVL